MATTLRTDPEGTNVGGMVNLRTITRSIIAYPLRLLNAAPATMVLANSLISTSDWSLPQQHTVLQ